MTNASFSSEVLPELRAQATTPAPEQRLVRYALICAWLTARCEKAGRQERYARAMEGCLWATLGSLDRTREGRPADDEPQHARRATQRCLSLALQSGQQRHDA